ncbi:hypothetical protein I4F81_004180 [Pyropia yezoensis]|uniref:Uncharacterized protein n=1 Tax=Pyropia yezoensis TaxID=2788 RepID=A0ACC3BVP6_PYRYE|nr:hypothetical protein I4F81_004180 [Neopyropia yezoensis]
MVNAGARVALGAKADSNVMSSGWPEEILSILETTAASVLATELFERGWAILQGASAVDDGGLHVDDLWSPIINTKIDSLDLKITGNRQGRLTVGVDALCSSGDNERHSLYLCKLAADVGMVALA